MRRGCKRGITNIIGIFGEVTIVPHKFSAYTKIKTPLNAVLVE